MDFLCNRKNKGGANKTKVKMNVSFEKLIINNQSELFRVMNNKAIELKNKLIGTPIKSMRGFNKKRDPTYNF